MVNRAEMRFRAGDLIKASDLILRCCSQDGEGDKESGFLDTGYFDQASMLDIEDLLARFLIGTGVNTGRFVV